MVDVKINQPEEIRSKPLIELLRIAEVQGVIIGWSVNGPSIVLRRSNSHILVRAIDAAALLVRLMAEEADSADDGELRGNTMRRVGGSD